MPMVSAQFVPHEQKTSIIKIYSYEHKSPCGIVENPRLKNGRSFHGLTELLLLITQLQDEIGYPQESMQIRTFPPQITEESTDPPLREADETWSGKPLATFSLNILFRQNASWQGRVVWLDREMESPFRSALELVILMDSVLAAA